MKNIRHLILSLGIVAMVCLVSCVGPPPPGAGPGVTVGVGYYDALPVGWDEPYYFYGNRYYYGGAWEPGHFRWHGRAYEGRYRHNGHVYYGGRFDGGHHHAPRR